MFTVVGIRKVDYKRKTDGERVQGNTLYLTYERDDTVGIAVAEEYCSSSVDIEGLQIGDIVELFYNKWGKVSAVGVQTSIE